MAVLFTKRTKIMLAGVCGAALGCLAASFLADRFLPEDLVLTQKIEFNLPPESPFHSDQWVTFAQDQKNCTLPSLAQKQSSSFKNIISVAYSQDVPDLFLRFRTQPYPDALPDFQKLIRDYLEQRAILEKSWQPKETLPPDPYEKYQLAQLETFSENKEQVQKDLTDLTQQHNRTSALAITKEKWLTEQKPDSYPADFEKSIAEKIQETFARDETLQEIQDSLRKARENMADLDRSAGQAQSAAALAQIDSSRNTLSLSLQGLNKTIVQRQNFLADQIRETFWPTYKGQLKTEIEELHLEQVSYSLKKKSLAQQLNRIQSQIDEIKKDLDQCRQEDQRLVSLSLPPPAFQPRLVQPLPAITSRTTWSRTHYLLVILSTLFGGLLGWFSHQLYHPQPKPKPLTHPADQTETDLLLGFSPLPAEEIIPAPAETTQSITPIPAPEPDYLAVIDLNSSAITDSTAAPSGYELLIRRIEDMRSQIPCPRILITAAEPADTSPRFAVNLGIALTRKSLRVLLVEADQTSSDLSAIFQITGSPGFFEWRRGQAWTSQVARKTQLTGLTVMACGTPDDEQNSPELDLSKESHRWNNLSNTFDVVLLFSPAALTAEPQIPQHIPAQHLLDLADGLFCLTRKSNNLIQINRFVSEHTSSRKTKFLGTIILKE